MRKSIILILTSVLCACLLLPLPGMAYEIEELDLHLSIPSGYDILEQNMGSDAPVYAEYGLDYQMLNQYFIENHIYLNAISKDGNNEIVVTCTPNGILDFSQLSEAMVEIIVPPMLEEYKNAGMTVTDYSLYPTEQLNFLQIYCHDSKNSISVAQYCTMYDGNTLSIALRSYDGTLTEQQKKVAGDIAASVRLPSYVPQSRSSEITESFVYNDTSSGASFTVPAGWKEEPLMKEREFLDAKFVSQNDLGRTICYGSTDLWSQLPSSQKTGYTREDLNMTLFSEDELAQLIGLEASSVATVTYGGCSYYAIETSAFQSDIGLDITSTYLLRVDNGWLYTFQYSGTSSSTAYTDFELMLNSIQYSDKSSANSFNSSGKIVFIIFMIVAAAAALVVTVVYLVKLSHKKKQTPCDFEGEPQSAIYCPMCGAKLSSGSQYCHVCGTKIKEEKK